MSPAAWAVMALAGGAGAVCRYLVDGRVTAAVARRRSRRAAAGRRPPLEAMPVGTIVVNLTACFALGLLTGWAGRAPAWVPGVLGTGFLGGYSTFSTACVETARLLLDDAGTGPVAALVHLAAMTAGTLAAAAAGLWIGGAPV